MVNERDEIGNDLVPDYLTSVKENAFYGWPYSYYGQHVDPRVKPARPDLVAKAIPPDYALGSHVAPLGLVFYTGQLLPARFLGGAFVGLHGSWNRKPRSGYKVVFVPFADGRPVGTPEDVLTGFVDGASNALGRPVGWRSMEPAPCLLPMTWGMSSGGSRPRGNRGSGVYASPIGIATSSGATRY